MLAWEKVSAFVCNGSIEAAFFSTTFFAYVLFAIMTHFSDRLFATQPYLNDIKRILAHDIVRSDVFIDLNVYFINLHINVLSLVLDLPQCMVLIWSFVALLNSFCILTTCSDWLVEWLWAGLKFTYVDASQQGPQAASRMILTNQCPPLCSRTVIFPDSSAWTALLGQ